VNAKLGCKRPVLSRFSLLLIGQQGLEHSGTNIKKGQLVFCINRKNTEYIYVYGKSEELKKCVVLQVNYAAVRIRLVVFGSKIQIFSAQITEQTGGGRES
jgi:hypothetical protein